MKLFIVQSILIIGLCVGSIVFYDQWKQEEKVVAALKSDLQERDQEIKALNSNKEQELNGIASDFVKDLFTYDSKTSSKPSKMIQDRVIGEAMDKLMEKPKEGQFSEHGEIKGDILSSVSIKDANYNKMGSNQASVIVTFEQEVLLDIKSNHVE